MFSAIPAAEGMAACINFPVTIAAPSFRCHMDGMIGYRAPRLDELEDLSQLCLRSKAVWGYDEAFLDACREELSITSDDLRDTLLQVADDGADGSGILGLAQLSIDGNDAALDKLFIDPLKLRTGVGKRLFEWAVQTARSKGAGRMIIEADPEAAEFYRRMGARDAGTAPSAAIPDRFLPRLVLDL